MDCMGYNCFLFFEYGLPMGYFASIKGYCIVFVSKLTNEGKTVGYMGYDCFLLFHYGLPLGYFCA